LSTLSTASPVLAQSGEDLATFADADRPIVYLILLTSLIALGFAALFAKEVLAAGQGTPKMIEIAKAVQEGAAAYLSRQFKTLAVFAVLVFLLLFLLPADSTAVRVGRPIFFLVGALFSALVGFIGMTLATRTNLRVANAANESGTKKALRLAFRAGGVVGMFTVGLGLFGATIVLLVYGSDAPRVLEGFAFGGALLAMFMRVGGGIFQGGRRRRRLVGKVEQGIPEDDPRNAATIADNVGDNVGDCAGMAADLFESYAVTLVAALILGQVAFGEQGWSSADRPGHSACSRPGRLLRHSPRARGPLRQIPHPIPHPPPPPPPALNPPAQPRLLRSAVGVAAGVGRDRGPFLSCRPPSAARS
jgi:K(+)-stimulated pyrophosphate-energized sodium pump